MSLRTVPNIHMCTGRECNKTIFPAGWINLMNWSMILITNKTGTECLLTMTNVMQVCDALIRRYILIVPQTLGLVSEYFGILGMLRWRILSGKL